MISLLNRDMVEIEATEDIITLTESNVVRIGQVFMEIIAKK